MNVTAFSDSESQASNLLGKKFVMKRRGTPSRAVPAGAASSDFVSFTETFRAVASGEVERDIALCGSGVGASIATNKVPVSAPALSMMSSRPIRE